MLFDPYSLLPPMGWLAVAILSAGAWSLLIRAIMREEKDFLASTTLADVMALVYLALGIVILGENFGFSGNFDLFSLTPNQFALPAIASILYVVFMYCTFKGSQKVEGSIRPVLGQTQSIWTVILSVIFLSEFFDLQKAFAIALIISGSVLSVYRKGSFKLAGVGLILVASAFVGTASIFDKLGLDHFPALIYAIPMYVLPPTVFFLMMGKNALSRLIAYSKKYLAKTALLAFFSILSYVALLLALAKLDALVAIPLLNTFVIVTAFGGIIFLGEKEGWQFKIAGAILAFIGAVLIS